MPQPTYPFRVDQGLLLEDIDVLLPWSATLDELAKLADATRYAADNLHAIDWGVHHCFGGLHIAPTRLQEPLKSIVRVFKLRMVDLEAAPPREMWEPALDALTASFGPPHERGERNDGYADFPFAAWYFGNVRLSHALAERFVEYTSTLLYKSEGPPPRLS